jgi:hypothetical protein
LALAALRPTLLTLDLFVRLHRIDENVCSEVAPLLAYLRDLQRRFVLAIRVVHHARKGAGRVRARQALRGSSEFHAWIDSAIYHAAPTLDQLRRACRMRTQTLCEALAEQVRAGRVLKSEAGYRLA